MPKLKLTAAAAVAASIAWLTAAPAAIAGPWLAPWALGHVIGAAARLATLPIIAASAASSAGPPPPGHYASAGYYGPPAYYAPPAAYYSPPPAYYAPPYYNGPQAYYPAYAYRTPTPYVAAVPVPGPFHRYSGAGMRYSGAYGGAVFGRSRGLAYRRW
jgi:hypothetical protein